MTRMPDPFMLSGYYNILKSFPYPLFSIWFLLFLVPNHNHGYQKRVFKKGSNAVGRDRPCRRDA